MVGGGQAGHDVAVSGGSVSGSGPIRVMLVDDHPVVCAGLRAGLERFPEIVVDCEAADGATALELAGHHDIDVAIVDIRLPGVDGLEVTEKLRTIAPSARVILISGDFTQSTIERGIRAGVHGFALKTESPARMAAFVQQVSRGEHCCSGELEEQLHPGPEGFRIPADQRPGVASLSAREREMLIALASGASLKQAATTLGITYKSADYLKQSVMKKLHIHDRVELARFAVREGLMN